MKYLFNSFFLIMYIRGFQIDDFVLQNDLIYANLKWEVYDQVLLSTITYFYHLAHQIYKIEATLENIVLLKPPNVHTRKM